MKKISISLVGIAFLFTANSVLSAENKDIQVVAVVGTAKAGGRNLRAGDHIRVNEVIETDENSGCKIRLGDRTVIDIAASSVFRVESVRGASKDESVTRLESGAAKASVPSNSAVKASVVKSLNQKPKFYMKTKWSVIAVRGTKFFVAVGRDERGNVLGCNEGALDVMDPAGGRVLRSLTAGRLLKILNPANPASWSEGVMPATYIQAGFENGTDDGGTFETVSAANSAGEGALSPNRSLASQIIVTGNSAVGAVLGVNSTTSTSSIVQPAGSANTAAVVQVSLAP